MSVPICIKNGGQNSIEARVNDFGVLATGAISFSASYNATLSVDNTPVNVLGPMDGANFIITGIYIKGSKAIDPNTDATFVLYENATGPTSATQSKIILSAPVGRSESLALNSLNILISSAVWLNATASDSSVSLAVFGYYIMTLLP